MTGRNWEHMDEVGTAVNGGGGQGARWGGAGHGVGPHGVLPPVLVAAAAVLVYLNALGNGFAYDDIVIVRDNPLVHGLSDPLRIWLSPYWPGSEAMIRGLYRPLTSFVFALQWGVGGGAPWLFHGVSVLLHAWTALLLYRLLNGVVGWRGATAGAVLFAVHPVHVEAVANVVGQGELLSAVMVLGAAVVYAERPRTGITPGRLVLVAILYLGALLAKEHAIVLPVLLVSVDGAQGRWRRSGWGAETARTSILLLAVAAVYLTLRWVVLGGTLSGEAATFLPFLQEPRTRILMALRVWPEYARLLLAPVHLSATYDPGVLPPPHEMTPGVVGGAVLLLAVLGAVMTPRAWPALGWGALWFLAAVLPVSNLVLPIGSVLAERTLYLPSVALALWTGFAVSRIWETGRRPRWLRTLVAGGLVVAVGALAFRTVVRNPVWSGNERLVADMLATHPESFRANWFRAIQLAERGDIAGSLPFWDRAEAIYGNDPSFLVQYGNLRLRIGDPAGAESLADRALAQSPDHPGALFLRGLVHVARGEAGPALAPARALDALGFGTLAAQLVDSIRALRPEG